MNMAAIHPRHGRRRNGSKTRSSSTSAQGSGEMTYETPADQVAVHKQGQKWTLLFLLSTYRLGLNASHEKRCSTEHASTEAEHPRGTN
jgi:hypothetical protein